MSLTSVWGGKKSDLGTERWWGFWGDWAPAPFNKVLILLITATVVRTKRAFANASRALLAYGEERERDLKVIIINYHTPAAEQVDLTEPLCDRYVLIVIPCCNTWGCTPNNDATARNSINIQIIITNC